MDDRRLRLRDAHRGKSRHQPAVVSTTECEKRWCARCRREIRWFPIMADHDAGCPAVNPPDTTDKEKAARLAVLFEGLGEHWPEAAETARLLRRVK